MTRARIPRFRGRRTAVRAGAVAAVLALVLAGAAVAVVGALSEGGADAAAGVIEHEQRVAVGAGPEGSTVSLDTSVFTPPAGTPGADEAGRRAAVVLAHGFGGSKADLEPAARDLAAEGYVVLTYTARGFGDSGGLIHLNAPDHEIADVSALLDLLAGRDDVRRDAPGDPLVGIGGASYGGAAALMSAGYDDRVDAVVAAITWHDLGQALFPQSATRERPRSSPAALHPIDTPGVFKQRWAAQLYAAGFVPRGASGSAPPSSPATGGAASCGRFAPDICALYREAAITGRPGPGALDRLRRSSPAPVLDRVEAPTLLIQGQQDSLFGLAAADANARGIAATGTPVAVRWTDGGHDDAGSLAGDLPGVGSTAMADWFDHHLRGGADPGPGFVFALPVAATARDTDPERRAAPAYPLDGVTEQQVRLTGEPQRLLAPPGGHPSAITSLPGRGLGALAGVDGAGFRLATLPGQSASFETPAFTESHRVVGSPRVRLRVTASTPEATLFASLWVVTADGSATLPRQLVAPVRLTGLTPGRPRPVEVALPASVYEVEQGERLRLVVSSTDAAYAVPEQPRTYEVALADGGALRLPTVVAEPVATDSVVPVPLAATTAGVVVLALLVAMLLSRRRRGAADSGTDGAPLCVEGLVKTYPDGLRAVDDVSWRAERGQVVGLLGPNGAGKTTTMRMLVGLIHPDGGRTRVLGQEVRAGSPVLARVGALIEGPGFLPHRTGRENLAAYWAATGRPAAEAHVDEALAIAGLGTAVDRVVRSYSHGMEQRLGIAQAMLGLPDLLLLDEPTNGLDPPQIRALRGVLQEYAAAGRAVVVSSHLLAEVEQTCSHVVMMQRGRVVLTGAIADLLPRSGPVLVTVTGSSDDADTDGDAAGADTAARAADHLRGVAGVDAVDVDVAGRLQVRGEVAPPELVRILVEAGFAVAGVDSRRHLEDVFMALVDEEGVVG